MKLAILIAGEYREFKIAHKFWTFLKWPNVDCYFATWNKSIKLDNDITCENITEIITKEDITNYISVVNYRISNIDNSPYKNTAGLMIDRWQEAIRLMESSGREYDKVILIRPDLALEYQDDFLYNYMVCAANDNTALYTFTFGSIYESQNISLYEEIGDLIYFGNYVSIRNFLNLPIQDLLTDVKEHSLLRSFPPLLSDIHKFLGKNLALSYHKVYNLPIQKFCVVRSNCRGIDNLTYDECKLKAKEWWESRHKVFYDMNDNMWENHNHKMPIERAIPRNRSNLWKNYDLQIWNEIRQTWKWHGPDNEENFTKNFIKNKGKPDASNRQFCPDDQFISYSNNDITYAYNSFGFRTSEPTFEPQQEFENSLDYPVLAVAGCSVTEGIGLPESHIWHSQLIRKLIISDTKKPIAKFNLGKGGRSIDSCLRYLYISIQHNGLKPNLVYLLLPPIARKEIIINENSEWYIYNFIPGVTELNQNCRKAFEEAVSKTDFERYHNAFKNLLFLKWFLESKNIPWFFSSWSGDFSRHTLARSIKNFNAAISMPEELLPHHIETNMVYDKTISPRPFKQNIARDCMHYGPNSHLDLVQQMWKQLIDRPSFQNFILKTHQ
jgi:hypothetical protein